MAKKYSSPYYLKEWTFILTVVPLPHMNWTLFRIPILQTLIKSGTLRRSFSLTVKWKMRFIYNRLQCVQHYLQVFMILTIFVLKFRNYHAIIILLLKLNFLSFPKKRHGVIIAEELIDKWMIDPGRIYWHCNTPLNEELVRRYFHLVADIEAVTLTIYWTNTLIINALAIRQPRTLPNETDVRRPC